MQNIGFFKNKNNSVVIKFLKYYSKYYEGFFEPYDIKSHYFVN